MNFFNSIYSYNTEPLLNMQWDDFMYVGIISGVGVFLYFLLPVIKKFFENRKIKKDKDAKKQMIKDLILMKELQGEIDQEMREALIHSELRSKKEGEPAA